MSKKKNKYYDWICNYRSSNIYKCNSQNGCRAYHVLSPILYHIGLFESYKMYYNVILRESSALFFADYSPSILVVGIENEISAKFIIDILDTFEKPYKITFIDICETPLNRINSILSMNEKGYVKTELLNLFSTSLTNRLTQQDIIFADSLLKQFPKQVKVKAIRQMKNLLRLPTSTIFFREYVGNQNELIDRLWCKLNALTQNINKELLNDSLAIEYFQKYLVELKNYYLKSGRMYNKLTEFKNDVISSGLIIKEIYENIGNPDFIITATK